MSKLVRENINDYLYPKSKEEILEGVTFDVKDNRLFIYKNGKELNEKQVNKFVKHVNIPGLEAKVIYRNDFNKYVIDIFYNGQEVKNVSPTPFINKDILEEFYKKNFYADEWMQHARKMVDDRKKLPNRKPYIIDSYVNNKKEYGVYVEEFEEFLEKYNTLLKKHYSL